MNWNVVTRTIEEILKRGNTAEVKLVRGEIVVVEIHRSVKIKCFATGQS